MSGRKTSRAPKTARAEEAAAIAAPASAATPPVIELEARSTIVQAAALHQALSARLAQAETIVLDGSRVEEIDTAILQLLANLRRSCSERGIGCSWAGVSDTLRRNAALIGVGDMLGLQTIGHA